MNIPLHVNPPTDFSKIPVRFFPLVIICSLLIVGYCLNKKGKNAFQQNKQKVGQGNKLENSKW
jgi:hypothetical protein